MPNISVEIALKLQYVHIKVLIVCFYNIFLYHIVANMNRLAIISSDFTSKSSQIN